MAACSPTPVASPVPPASSAVPSSVASPSSSSSTVAGTVFVSSRYGYALVVPEGWTASETPGTGGIHPDEPGVDTFRSGQGQILSVVGESVAAGAGLDAWTCAIGRHLADEHAAPAESTETIDVAGQPARLTRSHVRFDPYVILYLNAELVSGDLGLTLSMESTTGDDGADEVIFRSLLASTSLTD